MHELIIAMSFSSTVNIFTVRGGHCTSKTLQRLIPTWKLAADIQQCKFPYVRWTKLSLSHQCLQGITLFTAVPIRTYFELWRRLLAQDGVAAYNLLLEPVITLRNGAPTFAFSTRYRIAHHIRAALSSEWEFLWKKEVNTLTWPWKTTGWSVDLQISLVKMSLTSTPCKFSVNNVTLLCIYLYVSQQTRWTTWSAGKSRGPSASWNLHLSLETCKVLIEKRCQ